MNGLVKVPIRFGFYSVLTNPIKGYEETTKILIDNGVAFVQLRMKDGTEEDVLRTGFCLAKLVEGSSTKLIINDYPAIARSCGAHGVHIGQSDMSYEQAKAVAGTNMIIGISTHSQEQTNNACLMKPDYIGVGPVFPTPTKKNPDPVIGLDGMKKMLSCATVPAVVIGGIDLSNLRSVLEAGAQNFCMVRQFTQSIEPEKTLKQIFKIYKEYFPI